MSTGSKIEWTEVTWNPTVGCAKVSPGCDNCYAIRTAARFQGSPAYAGTVHRGQSGLDWTGTVNSLSDRLDAPLHWREPRRIFVNSMSDLFHDDVSSSFIAAVFDVMRKTPQHTYQLLTKRHARMRALLRTAVPGEGWPLPNVWVGVSVEDQHWADIRIPALLDTPAAVRWISAEPLRGPVDLTPFVMHQCDCDGPAHAKQSEYGPALDWVVVGGESGPGARPMHPDWARSLRDQCAGAGVPYFYKQTGEWAPAPWHGPDGATHAFTASLSADGTRHFMRLGHAPTSGERDLRTPRGAQGMCKVGKKAAGRELDGRTWDEYPQAVPAVVR